MGDEAPAFTLPDADGTPVSLSDFAGQPVIVYFYPAAMTPGCTTAGLRLHRVSGDLFDGGRLHRAGHLAGQARKPGEVPGSEEDLDDHSCSRTQTRRVMTSSRRIRREEAVRQDRPGRHPLDDRDDDKGRSRSLAQCRRQGHRPRRRVAAGPRAGRMERCFVALDMLSQRGRSPNWQTHTV
ncbi:MAG: redoxin domain-containing protein [Luteolibacter sp.]